MQVQTLLLRVYHCAACSIHQQVSTLEFPHLHHRACLVMQDRPDVSYPHSALGTFAGTVDRCTTQLCPLVQTRQLRMASQGEMGDGSIKRKRQKVESAYRSYQALLRTPPNDADERSLTAQQPFMEWEPFPADLSMLPFGSLFKPNSVPFPVLWDFFWNVLVPELHKGCQAHSAETEQMLNMIEALRIVAEPLPGTAVPSGSASQQLPLDRAAAAPPAPTPASSHPPPSTLAEEEDEIAVPAFQVGHRSSSAPLLCIACSWPASVIQHTGSCNPCGSAA
jgi:hypothetical protein